MDGVLAPSAADAWVDYVAWLADEGLAGRRSWQEVDDLAHLGSSWRSWMLFGRWLRQRLTSDELSAGNRAYAKWAADRPWAAEPWQGKASSGEILLFGISPALPADGSQLAVCSAPRLRELLRDCVWALEQGFGTPWLNSWTGKVREELARRGRD